MVFFCLNALIIFLVGVIMALVVYVIVRGVRSNNEDNPDWEAMCPALCIVGLSAIVSLVFYLTRKPPKLPRVGNVAPSKRKVMTLTQPGGRVSMRDRLSAPLPHEALD
jgi:heme/copper-type cytochrome/quinol oxidase subunit 2